MTDRGVPIVDGAVACPFVAFEDDRESRASSPDQRHRCFAEVRPAPRAQAHQDAYCLSSAFPMCPTFQDWARREAARVQEETRPNDAFGDLPARRNPQRGWAAPPPWTGGGGQQRRPDDDEDPDYLLGGGIAGGGLAGSLAHQIAMDAAPSAPASGRLPLDQPARFDRAAANEPSFEPAHESSSEPAAPPMGHRDDNDDGWPLRAAPRDRDLPARPPLAARGADRSRAFDDDDVGD
jgi:hypothetical protein